MHNHAHAPIAVRLSCWLFGIALLVALPAQAMAGTLRFIVQPIQDRATTLKHYKPLADYLSRTTGEDVELEAAINFLTYWQGIRKGKYDLVLDAAHFTDYRMEKLGYIPLAKVPGTVSYSLVTHPDTLIFEPEELIGKKVATAGAPSLGSLRLQALFPNPIRQPQIIEVPNAAEALRRVENGEVTAAIVPTPLLANHPDLNVVLTTDPAPHVTFSVSPKVPAEVREKLRKALLALGTTEEGRKVLQAINFPGIEPADPKRYQGYERLLSQTWGY
ncbi:MAG: phosphate/phosphite/phosphonate ABC transporter substrate-binding protein [Gammaproteobacteria bacterium]|nr:MAG: phosphate/phosphite/phosphonate ABC transporter substrate-binding protein [Gammaproteobacteria bacterium]